MKDYIGYYTDLIPPPICDAIIGHVETQRLSDFAKSTYSDPDGVVESDDRVCMDEIWFLQDHKFYDVLKNFVLKGLENYSKQHPKFVVTHHTNFRLNKYSKGGFMSKHCDNIHHSHGQQYGYPHVSVLLFLNDDYEGGEFQIKTGRENYIPPEQETGNILFFPTYLVHRVTLVTKDTRSVIVGWIHGNSFV